MYKSVKNNKKKIAMTLTKKSDVKLRISMQKKTVFSCQKRKKNVKKLKVNLKYDPWENWIILK